MKKFFIILTLLILLIVSSVFGVLFTKPGNNFIASYIENKVNDEQNNVQLKVNDLSLTFNTINFDATINDNSNINIAGDLQIFKKTVDLKYDIKINDLAKLENLTKQKLNGPFSTSGTFVGNEELSVIEGISNFASSDTKYKLKLEDFSAKNINFSIKNAKINELLHLVNQPIYAKGNLTVRGNIKDANIPTLDGRVTAIISKGKLDNKVVNKHFNQNIQTSVYFKSDVRATLIPNQVKVKSDLITSLADLFTKDTLVDLKSGKITTDYKVDVKNLAKLQSIIGAKLNGNFITTGDAVIHNGTTKLKGMSDILNSKTAYDVNIANAKTNVTFTVKEAKIDKLLHMLNEPVYARGNLNITGKINDVNPTTLDGQIITHIVDGKVVNPVVNTVFKQNLKKPITFKVNATTALKPNKVSTKLDANSTLANLDVKEALFNLKDSSLISDYTLAIPSLAKLYDVTATKMRGAVTLTGNMKSKAKALSLTGNSNLLGGSLNFNLKNDDLKANVKNVELKKLTHMLYYPEVFDSKANLDLNYNLLYKKGKLSSTLTKGHFLPNDFSALINQFAKFDITREVYDTTVINSNINDKVLTSTLTMQSKRTKIDVTQSTLNLEKSTVDAKINAKINTTTFAMKVKGNTKNPKITLDTKALLKNQINKQLDKRKDKIKEKLDKVLKGKLGEDGAEDVLKGIKSLF